MILQAEKFGKRVASRDISNYKFVRKGQIVVGFPMDEGVIFALRRQEQGAVSPAYNVWEVCDDAVDIDFLDRMLKAPFMIDAYRMFSANVVQRRRTISKSDFRRLRVALPPLPEQRAIALVLRTVQGAKEATEKVIAACHRLKQSLMRHLFTYGPVSFDQADKVALKETEDGAVPQHWVVKRLGDIASLSTGTTPSTKNADYYTGSIPFVKTAEIANNVIGQSATMISRRAVEDYNLKLYPPGAVFMAMYGQGKTRGQVGLLAVDATTTQNTAAIVPGREIKSDFLWLYLMSIYEALRGKGFHGQVSHLNLGYVRDLSIPVPPFGEQQAIAATLMATQRKLEAEQACCHVLETLFNTLLHHLMTGKVRVKKPGEPSCHSAAK